MKKVGIITSYAAFHHNYGAALQGYALAKQIELLGYTPEIIPYISAPEMPRVWRGKAANRTCQLGLYRKIRRWIRMAIKKTRILGCDRTEAKFILFEDQYLPMYQSMPMDFKQVQAIAAQYDAFVCGSDQIWNPRLRNNTNDRGYFLDFAPSSSRRIAYAPSIGNSEIADTAKRDLPELIDKLHAVSIREKSGAKIIKDVCGIEAPVVLDPTLLLPVEAWQPLFEKKVQTPKEYIFIYRFGCIHENIEQMRSIVTRLGLPVIELQVSPESTDSAYFQICGVGPKEFVSLIANAKLVLTDSFHATVFSIISRTPFYTFCREYNHVNNMNSRMIELLEMTQLSHRMVHPEDIVDNIQLNNIDFDIAHGNIKECRKSSLDYLKQALCEE